jgi:hypothetical protein
LRRGLRVFDNVRMPVAVRGLAVIAVSQDCRGRPE